MLQQRANKARLVFLVSGGGGTLKFMYQMSRMYTLPYEIVGVIADRECAAAKYSREREIQTYIIQYDKSNVEVLRETLQSIDSDIVVTTIHKIIDSETLQITKAVFINLHYSLLPAFSGLIGMKTVDKAKTQNVQFIGSTVHYVSEIVDMGTVITQSCLHPIWTDDLDIIKDTVFKSACINLLTAVLLQAGHNRKSDRHLLEININNYNVTFTQMISDDIKIDDTIWENIK